MTTGGFRAPRRALVQEGGKVDDSRSPLSHRRGVPAVSMTPIGSMAPIGDGRLYRSTTPVR
jgi:hypothetical protein